MNTFLRTYKGQIVGEKNEPVFLRGVNLGGWLMMEAYFMGSLHFPEQGFKEKFKNVLGAKALAQFERDFRNHFIQEADIKKIARLGFNCMRVPFNYRLVADAQGKIQKKGLDFLDKVVRWAEKYRVWVILDLHAAFGCQNNDWHSDSYGKAQLWTIKSNQSKTYTLWEVLADRYKDQKYVAGYDLLNESVIKDTKALNYFYKQLVKRIRTVDKNHILFVEGNNWATDLHCLKRVEDDNYVLSIHTYEPLDLTFNFVPYLKYPSKVKGRVWNKDMIQRHLSQYERISRQRKVPIFVGEFGVNYRHGQAGEDLWLKDTLRCFNEFGFHWTYWTYKAIKNYTFPDGLMSYYENPPWVCREGPLTGWNTYHLCWPKYRHKMVQSWHTDQFSMNKFVLENLQKYAA